MRLILVFILCLFSAPKVLLAQDKQAKTVEEAAEEKEAYQRLQDSIFKKLKTVIATYPIKQQRTFLKDLLKEYPKEKKEKVIPEGWMDKGKVGVLLSINLPLMPNGVAVVVITSLEMSFLAMI